MGQNNTNLPRTKLSWLDALIVYPIYTVLVIIKFLRIKAKRTK